MKYKLMTIIIASVFLITIIPPQIGASFSNQENVTVTTIVYDANIQGIGIVNSSNELEAKNTSGGLDAPRRGVINFDTSSVSDVDGILKTFLNFTVSTQDSGRIDIVRMNGTDIVNDAELLANLGLITTNSLYGSKTGLTDHTGFSLDLGTSSGDDLEDQLGSDFFTVGFSQRNYPPLTFLKFNSSEASNSPRLIVVLSCEPPSSGDWIITGHCIVDGETISGSASDIINITGSGELETIGGTNITGYEKIIFEGVGTKCSIANGGNFGLCFIPV